MESVRVRGEDIPVTTFGAPRRSRPIDDAEPGADSGPVEFSVATSCVGEMVSKRYPAIDAVLLT